MANCLPGFQRQADVRVVMSDEHWKLLILQGAGLVLFGVSAAILANATPLAPSALIGWLLLMSGLFRLASGFGSEIASGYWSSMLLSNSCGSVRCSTRVLSESDNLRVDVSTSGLSRRACSCELCSRDFATIRDETMDRDPCWGHSRFGARCTDPCTAAKHVSLGVLPIPGSQSDRRGLSTDVRGLRREERTPRKKCLRTTGRPESDGEETNLEAYFSCDLEFLRK